MSHFYANIQGNRGEATRMGSKESGIYGHIRGWKSGAKVICYVNEYGLDVVEVYATGGSSENSNAVSGLIIRTQDGKIDYLTTKDNL